MRNCRLFLCGFTLIYPSLLEAVYGLLVPESRLYDASSATKMGMVAIDARVEIKMTRLAN